MATATLPELTGRIRDPVATFILDLLNNAWPEMEYRYDICRKDRGALTEHPKNVGDNVI
jgi:hypothetical protein